MLRFEGSGVGTGIAVGTAFVLDSPPADVQTRIITEAELDGEIAALDAALHQVDAGLQRSLDEIPADAPPEVAAFVEAHRLMVKDPTLRSATQDIVRSKMIGAESALLVHRSELIAVFDAMDDAYLRSKKHDVDQVIQQICRQLRDLQDRKSRSVQEDLSGRILIAHDLTPADTVLLMNTKMRAFATDLGSPISHVAILARSLNIPAVVGLHGAVQYIEHGALVAVDSLTGAVMVDPEPEVLDALMQQQREFKKRQRQLFDKRHLPPRTLDGQDVVLLANVELPGEIDAARSCGATGIGLYRTEYLFMNRASPPCEQEQYESYARVVKALGNVTIRTLDLGADKQVDGGREQGNVAINPALGVRAVRLCLNSPELFRTHLRAIYRASAHGHVQCLIPMFSNLEELSEVLDIVEAVKHELAQERCEFDPDVPLGGMIEVPAAAITADQFARRLDFLSIGTNDLIQYTLAIDRVDDEVNYLYDPLHTSVLRLVKHTIDAGASCEKPVSLCGEMASDTSFTRLLLGLGLRIFSMDPAAVPEVKQIIRSTDAQLLHSQVKAILDCDEANARIVLLDQLNQMGGSAADAAQQAVCADDEG